MRDAAAFRAELQQRPVALRELSQGGSQLVPRLDGEQRGFSTRAYDVGAAVRQEAPAIRPAAISPHASRARFAATTYNQPQPAVRRVGPPFDEQNECGLRQVLGQVHVIEPMKEVRISAKLIAHFARSRSVVSLQADHPVRRKLITHVGRS